MVRPGSQFRKGIAIGLAGFDPAFRVESQKVGMNRIRIGGHPVRVGIVIDPLDGRPNFHSQVTWFEARGRNPDRGFQSGWWRLRRGIRHRR